MFSIQKFFAKDDEFFQLLEASAQASCDSINTLKEILRHPERQVTLEEFANTRRKDKQITGRINALLARTSITSLDPEDIESIAYALYKIPKTVEKFAERYLSCADLLRGADFSGQLALAEQATAIVSTMIKALEKSKFDEASSSNERLQTIEGDADKLMLQLLAKLYKSDANPMTVVMLKDLYELLERVVDRCRDAGNVVANVVLKHS
jgi:uncharacterized protein